MAERIAAACVGRQVDIYVHEKVADCDVLSGMSAEPHLYRKLAEELQAAFGRYDALIFIMAAGIVVRSIAPHIAGKLSDPAVLVLDDRGQNIISLLSGHVGGANELTRFLAAKLHSNPVITTATDVNHLLAPDVLAGRLDMVPWPKENLVVFNGALLRGREPVYLLDSGLKCRAEYEKRLLASHVPYEVVDGGELAARLEGVAAAAGSCGMDGQESLYVVLSDRTGVVNGQVLYLRPRRLIAGAGCRRGTPAELVLAALQDACGLIGWEAGRIDRLASTAVKADEEGLLAAADRLRVPISFLDNQLLAAAIERYGLKESAFVKKNIGVGNVCEAAALCCAERGRIALPKRKYEKVTVALIWEK
ncbi:cobalt-precorrin 5A hydrolase [Anaerovibrio sp.]|uniref:cobalt-precorrin 5A hydrolase n=1 Tax=Anaerovibrio sp. TaxID=1872532 RepID=UPI003F1791EE